MKRILLTAFLLLLGGGVVSAQNITVQDSGVCSTAGAFVSANVPSNAATVAFTIDSASAFSGTISFVVSRDGTTNFTAVNAFPPNSTTGVTSTTSAGTWQANVAGYAKFCVYASSFSSGTAKVGITISNALASSAVVGSGGGGGGGTPGGSPTQLQFNNTTFGGVAGSAADATTGAITLTAGADTTTPLTVVGHSGTATVPVQILRSDPTNGAVQLKLEDATSANNFGLLFTGAEGGGTTTLDGTTDAGSTFSGLSMTSTTVSLSNGDGSILQFDKNGLVYGDGTEGITLLPNAAISNGTTTFPAVDGTLTTRAGYVSCTQATPCASTPTALFTTVVADSQFAIHAVVACTGATSTATAILTIGYTDVSNTSQTITAPTAACTTLGSLSVASVNTTIRSKTGTAINYSIATANTPLYQASVAVIYEGN